MEKSKIIIKDKYVELESLEEFKKRKNENKKDEISLEEEQLQSLKKDIDIYLDEKEFEGDRYSKEILRGVQLRLGKMRIEDIAYDLDIKISIAKKYKKIILRKCNIMQREIILQQEQKIEELREKILSGTFKKRYGTYTFGVEGLVRGIIIELLKEGKSYKDIERQTNITVGTVYYHNCKIREEKRRKYPPRIMNMRPNKDQEVEKLLKKEKRQRDICKILDISSATASVITNRIVTNRVVKNSVITNRVITNRIDVKKKEI